MNIFKTPEGYIYSNKALLALFIPLLIEYALEFFVGFADSIMVASLGEAAISGVSLVDFLIQLLIFSFSALATGGAVVAGQYLGNKQIDKAQDSATQLVWFSTILSVILMIIVIILRQYLIGILFGQIEVDVWQNADKYLYIVALSIPFLAIYNAGASIFRTTNNASLPMKILFICDILNIVGNAICIYYLGWDVRGVAIPTVISRLLSAILILHFVVNEDYKLHIKRTLIHKFDFKILRKVLQVGIPYGIENGLFQLGRVLVLSIVSTFGTMAIAANSVGYAVGIFSVLPGFAINLGLTAIISRCVGANDYEQVRYYNKKCLIIVFVSHIVINLIIFAALPLILNIYNLSAKTAAMTSEMIIWHGIFGIIIWPLSFTLPATFRGAGDSKSVMYISLIVMFTCRIALSYVIADFMGVGVFGTWIAMFIDWYVRAAIYIYRYFSNKWTEYRVI
ncbi:putative efflux protein, MATE family [Methanobrevibacter gottschalkii]|uniref:Multidrug-efflux transporter n=1 Tax=Methanobrevibacter gottschalkii TaxID=190974 RepID=A0A1H7P886_9EURY|nr:MATE family efflux transporter [Methanobrevibacter gottschalkii]MCQ2971545.1 MATE family efflux transporter [archaeon]SEL31972.1 putative efflux protein, MATE family [Methanobrevibacter gottschalkii]